MAFTGNTKSMIFIAAISSVFAAILVVAVVGIGLYFYYAGSSSVQTVPTEREAGRNSGKPGKRVPSSLAPESIVSVTFKTNSVYSITADSMSQFFGNVNVENFMDESSSISIKENGTAIKTVSERKRLNGKQLDEVVFNYKGNFEAGKFGLFAKVLVENDFLNEPDSKNVTSMLMDKEIVIEYSSGVTGAITRKRIVVGDVGKETPELELIMRAYGDLEGAIKWTKE